MKKQSQSKLTLDPVLIKQQRFKLYLVIATFFFSACVMASLVGMYLNPANHEHSFFWLFDSAGVEAWFFLLPCLAPCFAIYPMNSDDAIASEWVRNYAKNISRSTCKDELKALRYDDVTWLDGKLFNALNEQQWSYYLWLISNGVLPSYVNVNPAFVEKLKHSKDEKEAVETFMQYYRHSREKIKLLKPHQFKNRLRT